MDLVAAVFVFSTLSAALEGLLLLKLKPRTRLRLLGSPISIFVLHSVIGVGNLLIHFGTVTGSMTAITAALTSFAVVPIVRWYSGYISNGLYFPGIKQYLFSELV